MTNAVPCAECAYRLPKIVPAGGDTCPQCGAERQAQVGGARAGAGRPVGRLGPTAARSVSLPETLWAKADELVASRGLPSRSALFVQMLQRARA